jgi:hypothetical protein
MKIKKSELKQIIKECITQKLNEDFGDDNFKPQGGVQISNSMGIEIEIDNRGENVRWRYVSDNSDPNNIKESEILYDSEGEPYFLVGNMEILLSDVMRFN